MPSSQTYTELNIRPTLTQKGIFYVHMDKLTPKQEKLPKHKGCLSQKDADLLSGESYLLHFIIWQMPLPLTSRRDTQEREQRLICN